LLHRPSARMQWSALGLATIALLLGLVAEYPLQLAAIGAPFTGPSLLSGRP
ncbi:MAG: hypothetical protein IH614_03850, partial [Desulfuromonadales bacterium]|nr:hypothetical protein [Desulfuromonadales bacterium]